MINRKIVLIYFLLATQLLLVGGCGQKSESTSDGNCKSSWGFKARALAKKWNVGGGALLSTRFGSLEEFKRVVILTYSSSGSASDTSSETTVKVCYCSDEGEITSVLVSGPSQEDIQSAQNGTWLHQSMIAIRASEVVNGRQSLARVLTLARRVPLVYGEGDPAFFDLAESTVSHIRQYPNAFETSSDSSEKGYLNTFNHVIAQALITTLFSESVADLVADLHERKNMPSLTHGKFSSQQLGSVNNNPVDNYVDMINNEIGQELGKKLKDQFGISHRTKWTPFLLSMYLNELQAYFGTCFRISFAPFRQDDPIVIRFAEKLGAVIAGVKTLPKA